MKSPHTLTCVGSTIVVWVLVALLGTGCASMNSSIAGRRQAHAAGYEMLTPDMRAAVDRGEIKAAMSKDGVLIAWGKPSQTIHSGNASGETTTWIYQATYIQQTTFMGPYRMRYAYTPLTYVRAQVVFVDDLVKAWQTFPTPTY